MINLYLYRYTKNIKIMYNVLYYLIKYIQYDDNKYIGCSYNRYVEKNIKSKLIMVTLDKDDIFDYFNGNEIPDNYVVKEHPINCYKDFYKYSEIYIIFYNHFNDLLCVDGDINIVGVIFDYNDMTNYMKERHLFTSLKCNIYKIEKILYGYHTTKIDLSVTNFIYNIEFNIFSKLENCPKVMFLTINNIKIPFPEESMEDFENRIALCKEYKHQVKMINEESERLKLEKEELNMKAREERERSIERANKFLELSVEKQEEILNSYL